MNRTRGLQNHIMKITVVLVSLLTLAASATAQERLARPEALQIAFLLASDLNQLQATPIPSDVDLKRPVALRDGDYGAMVLPEAKLDANSLAKAGADVIPVGQLWLHRLTPIAPNGVIWESELRMARVNTPDGMVSAPQCALGVRRDSNGRLELLVFGRRNQPLLHLPLKEIQRDQTAPIEMSAERGYDDGTLTLRLLGRFEATLRVTEL